MAVLRTDIEKALDEIISQEEGMRFQGLAIILARKHWPQLIARQRKKDFGLDAYAPASLTPEKIGKGLAASITPALQKISSDAKTAKENFPDLKALIFATPSKVGNADRKRWATAIQEKFGLELHIIEREEIITQMLMPENAALRASFFNLEVDAEPLVADLIDRARRAAGTVIQEWADKTKGQPLIDLTVVAFKDDKAESTGDASLEKIEQALSQSRRIILEGSAGRGKTTMLTQVAQHARAAGTPFMIGLPAWISSRREILEYISGMRAFQVEGLTAADLARVQQAEPFLFLLNGWNEIAESNSEQADVALRDLERQFPGAGIIVATRTHHLKPQLPGVLRLQLLPLSRVQRAAYLEARLGRGYTKLNTRIDADLALDELTRTPFILSEVASLFEAGAEIPSTKVDVLAKVLSLHEQRSEHRNALQAAPIFDRHTDYLQALATEMTHRGTVALPEADARAIVATTARELADRGQIGQVGAPVVLATLTAHHVLERIEYPHTAFQFEHQQLQEYYASVDARARLIGLLEDGHDAADRFMADYVNKSAWAEPLRIIAESFAKETGDNEIDKRNINAGAKLVGMALAVDLVFAGELAQLCGSAVWNEVRAAVGERFRAVYEAGEGSYRQLAIAAMLATGVDDFSDIIVPLLSEEDQQTRLRTYYLWPDFRVSSLGSDWHEQVGAWNEEVRADFVSYILHHRVDREVAAFAAEDVSTVVKDAAVSGFMWTKSDDLLALILESMDDQTFDNIARKNFDLMPATLKPKTIAAMRKFIERSTDQPKRLRTALDLIELGETVVDGVVKDALMAMSGSDMHNLGSHYVKPALEYLLKTDSAWASEWAATEIAGGGLYDYEYWLPFARDIPQSLVEKYLVRLETEDLKGASLGGMIAMVATCADTKLAARVFQRARELRCKVIAEPGQKHKLEWQILNQLEALFRQLPDEIVATGVLSSVKSGDGVDITVAAELLNRVAKSNTEPLRIVNVDLKERLRTYLKSCVDLVISHDDFNGEEKANLASSIAQVGKPEDIVDLVALIRADIERVRRGRAARTAGEHGPLANGGSMSYAHWHVAAVTYLGSAGADKVLIDLLHEPEYCSAAADAMARDFLPKSENLFDRTIRYDLMWAARDGHPPSPVDVQRRSQFSAAINAEIKCLRERSQNGKPVTCLIELAKALAVIDGCGFAKTVLDVISTPDQWGGYARVETVERLLIAGVVLPVTIVFSLVDSILERTEQWMQDSDRYLLSRILAICPFVDNPAEGIAKMRNVLGKRRFWGSELCALVTALGESRTEVAIDFLCEIASDEKTLRQCEDALINAFVTLDTPRARELLMAFCDPDIHTKVLTRSFIRVDTLVIRLAEIAKCEPKTEERLRELCERELPEFNRQVLSMVMGALGTLGAFSANLNLIVDSSSTPVPRGVRDHLKSVFVEQRPYEQTPNAYTMHSRASNELRALLFRMANEDERRRVSASLLLGQIEEWRLEYGRPTGEPRHPDLASGLPWPPES